MIPQSRQREYLWKRQCAFGHQIWPIVNLLHTRRSYSYYRHTLNIYLVFIFLPVLMSFFGFRHHPWLASAIECSNGDEALILLQGENIITSAFLTHTLLRRLSQSFQWEVHMRLRVASLRVRNLSTQFNNTWGIEILPATTCAQKWISTQSNLYMRSYKEKCVRQFSWLADGYVVRKGKV